MSLKTKLAAPTPSPFALIKILRALHSRLLPRGLLVVVLELAAVKVAGGAELIDLLLGHLLPRRLERGSVQLANLLQPLLIALLRRARSGWVNAHASTSRGGDLSLSLNFATFVHTPPQHTPKRDEGKGDRWGGRRTATHNKRTHTHAHKHRDGSKYFFSSSAAVDAAFSYL